MSTNDINERATSIVNNIDSIINKLTSIKNQALQLQHEKDNDIANSINGNISINLMDIVDELSGF